MNWIYQNLLKWTPLAIIVTLVALACVFIVIWDTIFKETVPAFIIALLSLLTGGTGATGLINHGVSVTNGTIDKVAQLGGLKDKSAT